MKLALQLDMDSPALRPDPVNEVRLLSKDILDHLDVNGVKGGDGDIIVVRGTEVGRWDLKELDPFDAELSTVES